jgi:hypothetical protein
MNEIDFLLLFMTIICFFLILSFILHIKITKKMVELIEVLHQEIDFELDAKELKLK